MSDEIIITPETPIVIEVTPTTPTSPGDIVLGAGQGGAVGPAGPKGDTGATGPSGVIGVTAPITNSGTSTSAQIGINQAGLTLAPSQITGTAVTQADAGTITSAMLGPSIIQTYVQTSAPTVSLGTKYLWWDTSQISLTLWIEDGA